MTRPHRSAPQHLSLCHCLLAGGVALTLICASVAQAGDAPVPSEGKAFALNMNELDWQQDRRFPGLQSALLWVDPVSGQQAMLRRFPAGFAPPQHAHPESERIVLLSGTISVRYPGMPEKTLTPGAYSEIPPNVPHQARCSPAADCLFVLISSGAYEMRISPKPASEP